MSYIQDTKDKIKKMTKSKAISYLRGALAVAGDKKVTKDLRKLLTEVQNWVE